MSQCATSLPCRALADFHARAMPMKCEGVWWARGFCFVCLLRLHLCVDFSLDLLLVTKMTGKLKLGSRPNLLHPCLSLSVKQGYLCSEPFVIAVLPPAVFYKQSTAFIFFLKLNIKLCWNAKMSLAGVDEALWWKHLDSASVFSPLLTFGSVVEWASFKFPSCTLSLSRSLGCVSDFCWVDI